MISCYLKYKFIIFLCLLSLASTGLASQSWKFKVYLDEQEIGEHAFQSVSLNNKTHIQIELIIFEKLSKNH